MDSGLIGSYLSLYGHVQILLLKKPHSNSFLPPLTSKQACPSQMKTEDMPY